MMDYSSLEVWYDILIIEEAVLIAKNSAKYSRVKESYFPDNMTYFEPHVWVVSAICKVLEAAKEHYKDGHTDGWQEGYDECIRQRC